MPLGESMQSVIRSNKSIMLDKSKHFKKNMGGYNKSPKPEYDFPESTPELLQSIRIKLVKEQKKARIKMVSIFLILALIFMILFLT